MTIIPIEVESVQKDGNIPIILKHNTKKYFNIFIQKINIKYILKIFGSLLFVITTISITKFDTTFLYSDILNTNVKSISNILDINIVQKDIYIGDIFDMIITYDLSKVQDSNYIHFILTFDSNYLNITDEYNNTDNIVQDTYLFDIISKHKIDQSTSVGIWEFEGFNLKQNINKNKNIFSIIKLLALKQGKTKLNIKLFDQYGNEIENKNLDIFIK